MGGALRGALTVLKNGAKSALKLIDPSAVRNWLNQLAGEFSIDVGDAKLAFNNGNSTAFDPQDWTNQVVKKSVGSGGRIFNISKSDSPIWKNFENHKNGIRKNKLSGKNKEFYEWDYTHNDIEVYDRFGDHKGSMDPITGNMYKNPVPGRHIRDNI